MPSASERLIVISAGTAGIPTNEAVTLSTVAPASSRTLLGLTVSLMPLRPESSSRIVISAGWTVNGAAVPVTFKVSSGSDLSSPLTFTFRLPDPLNSPAGMVTVTVALE